MKSPKVKVYCSDTRFKLKVAVYRHTTTPNEISVHIEEVYPIPPAEPVAGNKSIAQVIVPGSETEFLAKIYPVSK